MCSRHAAHAIAAFEAAKRDEAAEAAPDETDAAAPSTSARPGLLGSFIARLDR